ncbi:MAG: hypothetical protein Kow0037_14220 [Calditrichia bacterium]
MLKTTKLFQIALLFFLLLQDGSAQGFKPFQSDSLAPLTGQLQLPNPFRKKVNHLFAESGKHRLQWWMFQNQQKFQAGFSNNAVLDSGKGDERVFINWQPSQPNYSSWGLDYRESSLYIPGNVREYLEYKMGRERYVPLASLTTAAYLAYLMYRKYGYLLSRDPEERLQGIVLEKDEIQLLHLLWDKRGQTATELYRRWRKVYPDVPLVFGGLDSLLKWLEKKNFLNKKEQINGETQYFPVLTRQELINLLNREMLGLNVLDQPQRWREIQRMKRLLASGGGE